MGKVENVTRSNDLVTDLPAGRPPLLPWVVRVRGVHRETADVFSLTVSRPDGACADFAPGRFNMLYAFGVGEAALSLTGDPDAAELVHTIRVVGPVTQALTRLQVGEALGLRGPFGSRWPLDEARGRDLILVAGGIGFAPLRPVIHHVLAHRAAYGRLSVLYGTRTPADVIYAAELECWRQRPDLQILVTVDRADAPWQGTVGAVPVLIPRAQINPARALALMCGPEIMMRFALPELERLGLVPEQVYLSLERNMQCAVGFCGHCQLGPRFICMDGPVFRYDRIRPFFELREA